MKLTLVLLFACLALDFGCAAPPPFHVNPDARGDNFLNEYEGYPIARSWYGWKNSTTCHWDSENGGSCEEDSQVIDPENIQSALQEKTNILEDLIKSIKDLAKEGYRKFLKYIKDLAEKGLQNRSYYPTDNYELEIKTRGFTDHIKSVIDLAKGGYNEFLKFIKSLAENGLKSRQYMGQSMQDPETGYDKFEGGDLSTEIEQVLIREQYSTWELIKYLQNMLRQGEEEIKKVLAMRSNTFLTPKSRSGRAVQRYPPSYPAY